MKHFGLLTRTVTATVAVTLACGAQAQQTYTLEQCREMAVQNNTALKIAKENIEIAGYDRKIAIANWTPKITATGGYVWNSRNLQLVSDEMAGKISSLGTAAQTGIGQKMAAMMKDPDIMALMQNPGFAKIFQSIATTDIASPINAIGADLAGAFYIDIQHLAGGAVSLEQPVFMGGKIAAATKMAQYAEQLARVRYDKEHSDIISRIDCDYWQIVSISCRKQLAQAYCELLNQMEDDVRKMIEEGVATEADALEIKVKVNEADMLLTKADNGLSLAKSLLCKECGLPMDGNIMLADENIERIPVPTLAAAKTDEEVFASRPEIKSLDLAGKIYKKKIAVARADMMPNIALSANYFLSYPNMYNGWEKKAGGMFSVGVLMRIPILHGTEALQKTRKAKAEARVIGLQMEEARKMVSLQVSQLRRAEMENLEKLSMAGSNLESAEENLRTAKIGFSEGVIPANTVLAAHTAWLKARSEYIDAGIQLQMCEVELEQALGNK